MPRKKRDKRYVARVKLILNGGRFKVEPGMVIELGDEDREQGINIDNLVKNQSVVPYVSDAQAEAIRKEWLEIRQHKRANISRTAIEHFRPSAKEG